MTNGRTQKDLVVLVADKNIEFTIRGLLSRPKALGVRSLTNDLFVHPEQDTGCLLRSHDFLRPFVNRYTHALVMLDRQGCGREGPSRETLEREVEDRLSRSGWDKRAVAVVLDPELEVWVWSDSPHVDSVLGWEGKQPNLKTWLKDRGFRDAQRPKPDRPKEAVEEALRLAGKARSSSNYLRLAQKVSLGRCTDPAFLKLKTTLQNWFSEEPA